MELKEAVKARHSVRRYTDRPLDAAAVAALNDCIGQCNAAGGLHIQLVTDEPRAFATGVFKYGVFTGVRNYLVMAGPKGRDVGERVGYYGERLVLLAQTLGLNTCWVGLTYKKIAGAYELAAGERVHCVIALGYGESHGVPHPQKPAERFYSAAVPLPEWFRDGIEAVVLAPSAVNQQKYRFVLHEGNRVEPQTAFSMVGYTSVDLGIAKYHFELGAGRENFVWI